MNEYEKHKKELIEKGYLTDEWGRKIKDKDKIKLPNENQEKQEKQDNREVYKFVMIIITIITLITLITENKEIKEYIITAIEFYKNIIT